MSIRAGAIRAADDHAPDHRHAVDWPALIEPVARRLLADRPCREHGGDLRYGSRGSLVVHLRGAAAGTFRDFEADVSGGTLALVEHLTGRRGDDARAWLVDERLIAPDRAPAGSNGAHSGPSRRLPAAPGTTPPASAADGRATPRPAPAIPTVATAAAILTASVSADGHPGRRLPGRA